MQINEKLRSLYDIKSQENQEDGCCAAHFLHTTISKPTGVCTDLSLPYWMTTTKLRSWMMFYN